jgi:hypothetical protein
LGTLGVSYYRFERGAGSIAKDHGKMNDIFGYIIIALTGFIIAVNTATTVSPKFRRWVYSKD